MSCEMIIWMKLGESKTILKFPELIQLCNRMDHSPLCDSLFRRLVKIEEKGIFFTVTGI